MRRAILLAAALALSGIAFDEAQAGKGRGSDMHNPLDNPWGAPTPEEFHRQEYERRRAFGYCVTLFDCGVRGRTGYTHLPHRMRGRVYYAPYPPGAWR